MKRYASILVFVTAVLLFTACGSDLGEIESIQTTQPTLEQGTETTPPSESAQTTIPTQQYASEQEQTPPTQVIAEIPAY
ncbi:MAG: hypothetical protein FWC78_09220, partial [Defluviitaleaceae bacterium]|nr:hypothetical protein [Defluviitaleaceae bacterium]